MVNNCSCIAIVLALLVNFLSALTIPLNSQNLNEPSNTTLSNPGPPLIPSFPREPFRYNILPYEDSQTSIIFTNHGSPLSYHDSTRMLLEAQVIVMREMARDPQHADTPVGRTRVFGHGFVKVTIEPQPQLNHAYLGLWLAGMMEAGEQFGFGECNMRFVDYRTIFGPSGFTLGTARFGFAA